MLTKNIYFKEFGIRKNKRKIKFKVLKTLDFYKNHDLVKSFSRNYVYDFNRSDIKNLKKFKAFNIIGMGLSLIHI